MKSKKALSILLVAALTTAAAGCSGGGGGGDASSATAVEMRVQRQAGTVTLSNDKGENVTLMEKMRLNAGHNLDTAKESFVMVSFDETKVMTLEENASASVVQNGNTLLFDVKKGNAFVNLTEELKGDQAVEVRSGNMVCGMTGTSIQIGKDADGKDTILVTETDNPDGVSITVTDQNGNVTFHLDAKPGEKVVLQDDTGTVDKTNYDLEDLSVTSLYVIGQYPELVQKTAETFNVPADHISTLSKLVSTEGENASPLSGAAAEVMEKALKDTKGATGDALNAEQSILANTRQLLDKVMAGQMTDEEKKSLLNTANEQMNTVVKAALDAGVQGEDLNNIAKSVAEHIANTASTAIDEGKSVTEITNETRTTGTNLGAAIAQNGNNVTAMEQAISQITNTPIAQQPAANPANPATPQPQTPQAGNQNPQQQENPAVSDDGGNDGGGSAGGESGGGNSGGGTTQPSSETPQPSQQDTPQPSGTEGEGGSGGQGSDQTQTGTSSEPQIVGRLIEANPYQGNEYQVVINNSSGVYNIDTSTWTMMGFYPEEAVELPVTISFPGTDIPYRVVDSINQIALNSSDITQVAIKGVKDEPADIIRAVELWDLELCEVSNSNTKISKTSDGTTATVETGSIENLKDFNDLLGGSISGAFYGTAEFRKDNSNMTFYYEGASFDHILVQSHNIESGNDYMTITPCDGDTTYRLDIDGNVTPNQ